METFIEMEANQRLQKELNLVEQNPTKLQKEKTILLS